MLFMYLRFPWVLDMICLDATSRFLPHFSDEIRVFSSNSSLEYGTLKCTFGFPLNQLSINYFYSSTLLSFIRVAFKFPSPFQMETPLSGSSKSFNLFLSNTNYNILPILPTHSQLPTHLGESRETQLSTSYNLLAKQLHDTECHVIQLRKGTNCCFTFSSMSPAF